jgi:hypothetical protein
MDHVVDDGQWTKNNQAPKQSRHHCTYTYCTCTYILLHHCHMHCSPPAILSLNATKAKNVP